MCKGKILWQFETIKVYKDLYGNKSHSSMTGWQELFFRHKSFWFLAGVATAAFEVYGWKFTGYLILIYSISSF